MLFEEILRFLYSLYLQLIDFGNLIFDFVSSEIKFGNSTFSVGVILFGVGFSVWIIYKALPLT